MGCSIKALRLTLLSIGYPLRSRFVQDEIVRFHLGDITVMYFPLFRLELGGREREVSPSQKDHVRFVRSSLSVLGLRNWIFFFFAVFG